MVKNIDSPLSPRTLNVTWVLPVKNNITTPPSNPVDGDRYRIIATATGAWAGKENNFAIWDADNNKWYFEPILEPMTWYDFTTQNWHYMSNAGIITQFDKIPLAESDVTGLVADLASKASTSHHTTHETGGSDAFTIASLIDGIARTNVLISAVSKGIRRGINFIAGTGVVVSASDDSVNEKVDVTLSLSGGGSHPLLDGVIDSDTVAQAPVRGMLILGNSTPKWTGLALGSNGQIPISNGTDLVYRTLVAGDIPNLSATYLLASLLNAASGVAGLNASSQVIQDPASKGAANGVASLDASGSVPMSQLVNSWGYELGRVTLAAAGNSLNISGLPAKKYLRVIVRIFNPSFTTGMAPVLTFNGDTGNNYFESLVNNGGYVGSAARANIFMYNAANEIMEYYLIIDIENFQTHRKMIGIDFMNFPVGGAATNIMRISGVWNNAVSSITQITISQTNNFDIGSEMIVLGHD